MKIMNERQRELIEKEVCSYLESRKMTTFEVYHSIKGGEYIVSIIFKTDLECSIIDRIQKDVFFSFDLKLREKSFSVKINRFGTRYEDLNMDDVNLLEAVYGMCFLDHANNLIEEILKIEKETSPKKVVFHAPATLEHSEEKREFDLVEDFGYSEKEAQRIMVEEDIESLQVHYINWLCTKVKGISFKK